MNKQRDDEMRTRLLNEIYRINVWLRFNGPPGGFDREVIEYMVELAHFGIDKKRFSRVEKARDLLSNLKYEPKATE